VATILMILLLLLPIFVFLIQCMALHIIQFN